jgi:excisionase family DNA binding protein
MEGWVSIKNAAKYADVSVRTMREMLKRGLRYSKVSPGMIRIRYSDIDEYFMRFQVCENQVDKIVDEIMRDFERKLK